MRIAPNESVVLNSANSAPFLILVEVYSVLDIEVDSTPVSSDQQTPDSYFNATRPPLLPLEKSVILGDGAMSPQEHHHQRIIARRKSIAFSPELNDHTLPPDEFSEKLKTAAVLLAQLYTQQERDGGRKKTSNQPSSNGKSRAATFETIRARVIEQMVL
jgi:hypothetical protein